MLLEFSRFIEGDLDDIASFIAQDNPSRAVTFIQEIRAKFQHIQRNPTIYQLRSDIGETARLATVGRYVILFRVMGEMVRVERVAYGGRDLPEVFEPSTDIYAARRLDKRLYCLPNNNRQIYDVGLMRPAQPAKLAAHNLQAEQDLIRENLPDSPSMHCNSGHRLANIMMGNTDSKAKNHADTKY